MRLSLLLISTFALLIFCTPKLYAVEQNQFSVGCVENLGSNPSNNQLVACSDIRNEIAGECVRILNTSDQFKISACSQFSNESSLACLRSIKKNPDPNFITTCSTINNELQAECVRLVQPARMDQAGACSEISSSFALNCIRDVGPNPSSNLIVSCSDINDETASECTRIVKPRKMEEVLACKSISSTPSLECLKNLGTKPHNNIIVACSDIRTDLALGCIKLTKPKTVEEVVSCALISSVTQLNANQLNCVRDLGDSPSPESIVGCMNQKQIRNSQQVNQSDRNQNKQRPSQRHRNTNYPEAVSQ